MYSGRWLPSDELQAIESRVTGWYDVVLKLATIPTLLSALLCDS